MTLENIYYAGQTVAVAAILISLTFVVLQLRQTQRNQRSIINQGVFTRDHEIMQMLQGQHMAEMQTRALTSETKFSRTEIHLMIVWVRAVIGQMQDVHTQRNAKLIDQATYEYVEAGVRSVLTVPLAQVVWPMVRETVSRVAAALGDDLIEDAASAEPLDDLPQAVSSALTEILARRAEQSETNLPS